MEISKKMWVGVFFLNTVYSVLSGTASTSPVVGLGSNHWIGHTHFLFGSVGGGGGTSRQSTGRSGMTNLSSVGAIP